MSDRLPSWWVDSSDYLAASESSWLGLDLWAGTRPAAMPVLLKLVGGDDLRFMQAQIVIAGLCWAMLAVEVARRLPERRAQVVAGGSVLGLSLAPQLTMWDRSVLSESLALATMALVLAMVLRFARRTTLANAAGVILAAALWTTTRDVHPWIVIAAAAGPAAWWLGTRRPRPRLSVVVCLTGVLAVAMLSVLSSLHGQRSEFPIRNVYQSRVLPYPDRVEWFADHGMPLGDLFVDGTLPPSGAEGQSPVVWVADDDQRLQEWSRWVESKGMTTYMLWMVTHPWYVATEPMQNPERAFNNAEGDRSFYAANDQRVVPFLGEAFLPSRPLAILLAGATFVLAVRRGAARSSLFVVGAAAVALALPHAAMSWHSDAMETARHLSVAVVQLHIGAVLMVAGVAGHLLARSHPSESTSSTADGDGDLARQVGWSTPRPQEDDWPPIPISPPNRRTSIERTTT